MKILVTGGAGFIGSHLTEALLRRKHKVHVIDNLSSGNPDLVPAEAEFHDEDVRGTLARQIVIQEKFDVIFHLAAQADVQRSISDPLFDADVNIGGTVNLLTGCAECPGVRFIYSSTSGVYGRPAAHPTDEDSPPMPLSYYGLSKLTSENYVRLFHDLYGVSYTVLRYANVYGPRQTAKGEGGVIAQFMKKMLAGSPLIVHGDGEQTRDFIYVDDVVQANLAAARASSHGVYNIGTAAGTSINRLLDCLKTIHPAPLSVSYSSARAGDIRHSCLSYDRARKDLGWAPKHRLDDALRRTYSYYQSLA